MIEVRYMINPSGIHAIKSLKYSLKIKYDMKRLLVVLEFI